MRTESQSAEAEVLIAPGEIRELIARLTEQSVESVPPGEARTLEGLSLDTGISVARLRDGLAEMRRPKRIVVPPAAWVAFAALAGIGAWAVRHTPLPEVSMPSPTVVAQPAQADADLSGTVPLTQVTYGPDGGDLHVDPGFEPSTPLPEGLSVSATVGSVLWGTGDHRAKALDRPFDPAELETIRNDVAELLRYVRRAASKRRLPLPESGVILSGNTYSGGSGAVAKLPPFGTDDEAAEAAIRRATKEFVDALQQQLQWMRDIHRQQGP